MTGSTLSTTERSFLVKTPKSSTPSEMQRGDWNGHQISKKRCSDVCKVFAVVILLGVAAGAGYYLNSLHDPKNDPQASLKYGFSVAGLMVVGIGLGALGIGKVAESTETESTEPMLNVNLV